MIKANTLQHKVESTKEALEEALPIAKQLKSPSLAKFIDVCMLSTEDEYNRKISSIASQRASKASTIYSGQDVSEYDIFNIIMH